MAKRRPKINLGRPVEPRAGDMERLFAAEGDAEQSSGLQLLSIRLEAISPDSDQPRSIFPESSLLELAESIRQDGLIQPIEVAEVAPNQYRIVHGERRWRAAQLAGLDTIPAVVRRHDYDDLTRLVRQMVENIQREDLNDVDRAGGLLRLRRLLQAELDAGEADTRGQRGTTPWSRTISWAKVGQRLGYSRQRIHQLIRLLKLPDEIKEDVREGRLTERETRVYQGLRARQQRDLHRARYRQELEPGELRQVARRLKQRPELSVAQATREVRNPPPPERTEQTLDPSFERRSVGGEGSVPEKPRTRAREVETESRPRQDRPTVIDRLVWIRGHLAQIQERNLSPAERSEALELLELIRRDLASLETGLR